MTTLHWRIIGLVAWLTFCFNIDQFSALLGQRPALQHIVVTVAVVIAALLPLLPLFQRRSLPVLALGVTPLYGAGLVLSGANLLDSAQAWQHLAGFILLMGTLVLSYRVAQVVAEFRRAIETITFSSVGSRLRNLEETRELVDIEMVRSRRFERPLSLVMIQADASSVNMQMHRLVQEVQRGMMQRYVLSTMARVLSRTLRRTDLVVEDGQLGRLLLLAPETGEGEAEKMGVRVARLIQERLGISARFGVATFPQQALTFEDLRSAAEERLQEVLPPVADELGSELLEIGARPAVAEPEHAQPAPAASR